MLFLVMTSLLILLAASLLCGRGKRSCIGQNLAMLEMRVLASALVRNFDFELVEEPEYELFVTMKPVSLKMEVSKRFL